MSLRLKLLLLGLATLVLVPATAALGGKVAAVALTALAFCGAATLCVLAVAAVTSGLGTVLRLARRQART